MRLILLAVMLAAVAPPLPFPDRERDRAALLAADRAHARTPDFLSVFADDARYLHPGAPLVRGRDAIRAVLAGAPGGGDGPVTWTPEYADVSDDGTLGYTYGWTHLADQQGKYLACWRKRADGPWRIIAYARTRLAAGPTAPPPPDVVPAPPVRGHADSRELLSADSAFSALSVGRGPKAAFLAFAAADALTLGGGGAAPMNHGRAAIGAAFADFPADAVLEWTPIAADIAGSGDLGCTVGEAAIAARRSYSKYLTVWKRQPDGAWRFVADGGNARPGP
jgi:ketosteroid isomerase-like protein